MTITAYLSWRKVGSPRDLKQDGGQPYLTRECATFITVNKPGNFGGEKIAIRITSSRVQNCLYLRQENNFICRKKQVTLCENMEWYEAWKANDKAKRGGKKLNLNWGKNVEETEKGKKRRKDRKTGNQRITLKNKALNKLEGKWIKSNKNKI